MIKEMSDGIVVPIKVQPRSSRTSIVLTPDNEIRAYLNAPPVDGAANQACVELLAKSLHAPKSSIILLSGMKSRNKVFKLQGISKDLFLASIKVNTDKN